MSMARTKESLTVGAEDSLRENDTSLLNRDDRMFAVRPQGVLKGLNTGFVDTILRDPPETKQTTTKRKQGRSKREIGSNLFRRMARARFTSSHEIRDLPTLSTPTPSPSQSMTVQTAIPERQTKIGQGIHQALESKATQLSMRADADTNALQDKKKPSLHAAAEEGNMDVLKALLEQGEDINVKNESHRTPLNLAAAKGNANVVRLLTERGAEVDSCDKRGWTPLHTASRFGHLEVSRVLIDRGANVNARQESSCTPLYLSACHGHVEIVKLLLERDADQHALNDKGETPYQVSLRSRRPEIVDLLRGGSPRGAVSIVSLRTIIPLICV